MKLAGVMMVRNEADIIEAAVRHNLTVLDLLAVIDHGSFDGTAEILRHLASEGLPLRLAADRSIEFQQSTRVTQATRDIFRHEQADFVFALDADEFLKVPSRLRLEEALRHLPPAMHVLLHWQTYVLDDFGKNAAVFSPADAQRRRVSEPLPINKVVVARHLVDRPREAVTDGNHFVWNIDQSGKMPPHARIAPSIAAVAHVPVRSRRQLEKKIVIGYLAHLAAHGKERDMAFHWREAYEAIRAGATFDAARLREIAANYGLRREDWQPADTIGLMDDPIAFAGELKYQAAADLEPLQLLMRFCERIVLAAPDRNPQ